MVSYEDIMLTKIDRFIAGDQSILEDEDMSDVLSVLRNKNKELTLALEEAEHAVQEKDDDLRWLEGKVRDLEIERDDEISRSNLLESQVYDLQDQLTEPRE